MLIVAVISVAITRVPSGNAQGDLPEERAQWRQAAKDEDEPELCTAPNYQGGNDVYDALLAPVKRTKESQGRLHVVSDSTLTVLM